MYAHERSLVKQLADRPFAIIGVNSDPDLEQIRETVKQKDISWRSFWNGPDGTDGPISTLWNISAWPTIYVLDGDGTIRYKNVQGDELDQALTTLLAEMGQKVDLSNHDETNDGSDPKQ
jgi:hypothetical protein